MTFFARLERFAMYAYFAFFGHMMVDPMMPAAGQNIVRMGKVRAAALFGLVCCARMIASSLHPICAAWALWAVGRWMVEPMNPRGMMDLLFFFTMFTVGAAFLKTDLEFKRRVLSILAWAGVVHSGFMIASYFNYHVYVWIVERGVWPWIYNPGGTHPLDVVRALTKDGREVVMRGEWFLPLIEPLVKSMRAVYAGKATGLMDQPTISGVFIGAVSYWHIMRRGWIGWVAWGICATAVFISGSSFVMASFLSGGALWIVWKTRPLNPGIMLGSMLACGASLLGIVAALNPWMLESRGRYPWWGWAWGWIQERWIRGWGMGSWYETARTHLIETGLPKNQLFKDLHNDPLEVLFKHGAIGLAIVLAGTALFFYQLRKRRKDADRDVVFGYAIMAFVLAIDSLGNFVMQSMPHALLLFLGWLVVVRGRER